MCPELARYSQRNRSPEMRRLLQIEKQMDAGNVDDALRSFLFTMTRMTFDVLLILLSEECWFWLKLDPFEAYQVADNTDEFRMQLFAYSLVLHGSPFRVFNPSGYPFLPELSNAAFQLSGCTFFIYFPLFLPESFILFLTRRDALFLPGLTFCFYVQRVIFMRSIF